MTWTAPADGGSTITGYTITPYVGTTAQTPTTITGNPPATTVTVKRLRRRSIYTFTVTATNAIGTGPASSPSNPVTTWRTEDQGIRTAGPIPGRRRLRSARACAGRSTL